MPGRPQGNRLYNCWMIIGVVYARATTRESPLQLLDDYWGLDRDMMI
ncbi:hypothetical protein M23134_03521 [Microscilla marina ATCC 23134]|uniref:Uncharacterized protein n=1 Tax=Microscilla marina ATCC 23134 TaxID=313606 RepID=A1ZN79_MICM2|nr:hypothetical protein M23134_03521 [Microscilla marina ATCC 23134]